MGDALDDLEYKAATVVTDLVIGSQYCTMPSIDDCGMCNRYGDDCDGRMEDDACPLGYDDDELYDRLCRLRAIAGADKWFSKSRWAVCADCERGQM